MVQKEIAEWGSDLKTLDNIEAAITHERLKVQQKCTHTELFESKNHDALQSMPANNSLSSVSAHIVGIDYVLGVELECGHELSDSDPLLSLVNDPTFVEFELDDVFATDAQGFDTVDGMVFSEQIDVSKHGYACTLVKEVCPSNFVSSDHVYAKDKPVTPVKCKLKCLQKSSVLIKNQKHRKISVAHAVKCVVTKVHQKTLQEQWKSMFSHLQSVSGQKTLPVMKEQQQTVQSKKCRKCCTKKNWSSLKWFIYHQACSESLEKDSPHDHYFIQRYECGKQLHG